MGKQRSRQLQDGRGFIKDGSVVGDRHTQRKQRGEEMIRTDRDVNREDYNLGWFHPTKAQNEIIRNMLEKECTLVDAPSGCGKSTTVIYQALKWLKSGDYRKIIFIKSPSTLSLDEVGFLGTNEAKFDFPLMAMRSIFESFMSKEKLEMDEILWNISSYGGYVNSLQLLLGWKNMCVAKQTHVLHSNADSCASAFFLSDADQYIVGDGATMFCHEIQAGVGGTTSNMSRHMEHLKKTNEDFIKRTYHIFLDETEIDEILKGVEVFLTADEIKQRLQHREEMKGKKLQQDIQDQLDTPADLSEHSTESLEEELKLLELDKKDIQAELRKRKKIDNSNCQVDKS